MAQTRQPRTEGRGGAGPAKGEHPGTSKPQAGRGGSPAGRRGSSDVRTAGSSRQRSSSPAAPAGRSDERYHIRLFDADRTDRELSFERATAEPLSERQLLWVDAIAPMPADEAAVLADRLELKAEARRSLEVPGTVPEIALHGTHVSLTVAAVETVDDREELRWITIVAGRNIAVTVHEAPMAFLEDVDARIERDTLIGLIDSTRFVAALLDAVVTTYFTTADAIEDAVDRLDARSLRRDIRDDLLVDLVGLRARLTRVRRRLAAHRELFAALARADFATITGAESAAPFAAVAERFDRAIGLIEGGRDLLLGSFEIYMTRTAQRTNDTMKVLTVVSVLLLPGGLIAGIMGMNVKGPLSTEDPYAFWVVVALIAAIACSTLVVLRLRRWL